MTPGVPDHRTHTVTFCKPCNARERIHVDNVCSVCFTFTPPRSQGRKP